jgi:predicted enzyme related to lactoylglutathione lyase
LFDVEVEMADGQNGKICYVEIPATDVARSAEFYSRVFGWTVRQRGDGATAFDDTTGNVSGAWVRGRPPQSPGLVVYIMVTDAEAAVVKIEEAGGEIVQPIGGDPGEITARFRDPGGNVLAIYQEPKQS